MQSQPPPLLRVDRPVKAPDPELPELDTAPDVMEAAEGEPPMQVQKASPRRLDLLVEAMAVLRQMPAPPLQLHVDRAAEAVVPWRVAGAAPVYSERKPIGTASPALPPSPAPSTRPPSTAAGSSHRGSPSSTSSKEGGSAQEGSDSRRAAGYITMRQPSQQRDPTAPFTVGGHVLGVCEAAVAAFGTFLTLNPCVMPDLKAPDQIFQEEDREWAHTRREQIREELEELRRLGPPERWTHVGVSRANVHKRLGGAHRLRRSRSELLGA